MSREPLTRDQIQSALDHISPDLPRDEWKNVAAALKTELGGDGEDLFLVWSQGGQSYDKGAAKSTWRSVQAGHVSIGTLIHYAKQGGWSLPREQLTPEERKRRRDEAERRRAARQAAIEADEKAHRIMQEAVASACDQLWAEHVTEGMVTPYLRKKGVKPWGTGSPARAVLLVIDDDRQACKLITGQGIRDFFHQVNQQGERPEHLSFMKLSKGDTVVPLRSADGRLWSLQVIKGEGSKKLFPKYGRKQGCYHLVGDVPLTGETPVLVAEGYATAATLWEVAGRYQDIEVAAVAVAFDAGNLLRVGEALRALSPGVPLLFGADNDAGTPGNPGVTKARKAAEALGNAWAVWPEFGQEDAA